MLWVDIIKWLDVSAMLAINGVYYFAQFVRIVKGRKKNY
jgi:hypothetical protein